MKLPLRLPLLNFLGSCWWIWRWRHRWKWCYGTL